jgi:hypothetical protein
MTLKRMLKGLRTPASELDLDRVRKACADVPGMTPIAEVKPRQEFSAVGEISSLRIVPRAGSASLEATITDGTGSLTAVWTGRRQIAGVGPGRRLVVRGRANPSGPNGRILLYNPAYDLL